MTARRGRWGQRLGPYADLERCSACGQWCEGSALFTTVDDRRLCEACRDDGLHLLNGEAP